MLVDEKRPSLLALLQIHYLFKSNKFIFGTKRMIFVILLQFLENN
jgi:hypothetical protein